jgi:CRP-like cAMP-binding protein
MSALQVVDSAPSPRFEQSSNRLLASLPPDEYRRLTADLSLRPLKTKQTIHKHGEKLSEVLFPARSVCSITNWMEDGGAVEVAMVGREGFIGIGALLGDDVATGEAFVQVQGDPAQALSVDTFRREMNRQGPFYHAMTQYSRAFVGMLMQSVACNGLHSAEERCCRWLLMTADRAERDEFPMTHELLAVMLGVRRPTVTLVLAELQRAGIVSHMRGQVRIVDRTALESTSCECYQAIKTLFGRLLPAEVHV